MSGDRPALPEIEITPEMIEAGIGAASLYDSRDSLEAMVCLVFAAMWAAQRAIP